MVFQNLDVIRKINLSLVAVFENLVSLPFKITILQATKSNTEPPFAKIYVQRKQNLGKLHQIEKFLLVLTMTQRVATDRVFHAKTSFISY